MKTVSKLVTLLCLTTAVVACSHARPAKLHPIPRIPQAPPAVVRAPLPIDAPTTSVGDESIYFSFDAALLREDAGPVLQRVARHMELNPKATIRIEGHCDERGTTEYNLALGDQRARAAKQYLLRLGIAESRIEIATYGSERPRNPGHDESAWAENRRDDLRVRGK
jgi:peptidoglycan-associated lipoprotein